MYTSNLWTNFSPFTRSWFLDDKIQKKQVKIGALICPFFLEYCEKYLEKSEFSTQYSTKYSAKYYYKFFQMKIIPQILLLQYFFPYNYKYMITYVWFKLNLNFQSNYLNLNKISGGVGYIYKRHTHSKIIFCIFVWNEKIQNLWNWKTFS